MQGRESKSKSSWSVGTPVMIELTRPLSRASLAVRGLSRRSASFVNLRLNIYGKKYVEPPSGDWPLCMKGARNHASGVQ